MSELAQQVVFKLANPAERDLALRLRASIYARELGHVPDDGQDEHAHHLIACDPDGQIAATFRLLGPAFRPFDFETSYDLSSSISQGRHPAFLGRLCVRPDRRTVHHSALIHAGLLKLAHEIARSNGFTDFFLYTFTHLLTFYRRAGFRPTGASFAHVGYGKQMHILQFDLTRPSDSS